MTPASRSLTRWRAIHRLIDTLRVVHNRGSQCSVGLVLYETTSTFTVRYPLYRRHQVMARLCVRWTVLIPTLLRSKMRVKKRGDRMWMWASYLFFITLETPHVTTALLLVLTDTNSHTQQYGHHWVRQGTRADHTAIKITSCRDKIKPDFSLPTTCSDWEHYEHGASSSKSWITVHVFKIVATSHMSNNRQMPVSRQRLIDFMSIVA
jgi:hypothetical protein